MLSDKEVQEIHLQQILFKELLEEMLVGLYMLVVAVAVLFVLVKQVSQVRLELVVQVLQVILQILQHRELVVAEEVPIQVQVVQFQEEQQVQVEVESVCQAQDHCKMVQLIPVEAVEAGHPEVQEQQGLVAVE